MSVCVFGRTLLVYFISFSQSFVQSVIAVMCVCVIVGQYVIRLVVVSVLCTAALSTSNERGQLVIALTTFPFFSCCCVVLYCCFF